MGFAAKANAIGSGDCLFISMEIQQNTNADDKTDVEKKTLQIYDKI